MVDEFCAPKTLLNFVVIVVHAQLIILIFKLASFLKQECI
jgi:hypothetical protein